MNDPTLRHATATVHGRYLIRAPHRAPADHWFIGFHGYAQSAAIFMPGLLRCDPAGEWLVASVQALHPFYTKSDDVVANWMTREDREHAIADNTSYGANVLDALAAEFGEPRVLVFSGFSQGVAQAYRVALNGRRAADALVTVGGDTPPELKRGGALPWPRVTMLTGETDGWYTPARLAEDATSVRAAGADVREQVFAGGHEWNDAVVAAVAQVLTETRRG